MAKNTIGQFIAALRKANGLTQQEVADRLNVSNKAVSRWERDECAPDLSVIPALAEMFDITCDELLKGERSSRKDETEKNDRKVEKQVKSLVNRTLSGFQTLIWVSLAVTVVGLVCMFGISYGFYRPVIGFAVMLLFEICGFLIAVLAVKRARDVKIFHELFEMADESLICQFNHTLGTMSFSAFFMIFAVILLSLPLILVASGYVNSVITPYAYFTFFFVGIVLILSLVYLKCKKPYLIWINGGKLPPWQRAPTSKMRRKMSAIQLSLTVGAGIIFVAAPYLDYKPNETTFLYTGTVLLGLGCLLASLITFAVFMVRHKENRSKLVILGVRNLLILPSALVVSEMHSMGWWYDPCNEEGRRYDLWYPEYFWYALALAAIVFAVFSLIEQFAEKRKK